ncbi:MAG TPA: D-TA family PLP-dependent enzyme [Chitinophagaceae bacterium]|nr:D-TA family PLP-dependent enzyme [Chitinophagaceae bacterium]
MNATITDEPWYAIKDIHTLDSPALVVYPDRVQYNIDTALKIIKDASRLRPHVKTHKTKEVALMLQAAGITKFKCATIAEAEMLALVKSADVLLAYQPAGPKIARFISLLKAYPATNFSCLVDNVKSAQSLSDAAVEAAQTISIYIDINVGMNRTGIAPNNEAVQLYGLCMQLPRLKPVGLHVYDGQINDADFLVRSENCNASFAPVATVQETLLQNNLPHPVIVAGGSATFPIHAARNEIECSPGTFVYWDWGYKLQLPEQPFLPAALVITRIISMPDNRTICTDLGHKSIASENNLNKRVIFLNAPDLQVKAHSEEHLLLEAPPDHSYHIGDVLYGLPVHICPTCALYEKAHIVEKGRITSTWKILARDRTLTI